MANYHFELSLENMRYMELTFPQDTVVFTLLQPWPKEESRLTAPIRPFNWIVRTTSLYIQIITAYKFHQLLIL